MKKTILAIALIISLTDCKKKTTATTKEDIYCTFYTNNNGARTFYKCVTTQAEMQQCAIEIRNNNYFGFESTRKATCSECK